jgi:hypothetical protein
MPKKPINPRLYMEPTILGYLTAPPSRDIIVAAHQQITKLWWKGCRNEFDIYISQFVVDEASVGAASERLQIIKTLPKLEILDEVTTLSTHILSSGLVPQYATDVIHIAIAAVHQMDFLMTWNSKHLANAVIARELNKLCQDLGLTCPVICTPEALMDEMDIRDHIVDDLQFIREQRSLDIVAITKAAKHRQNTSEHPVVSFAPSRSTTD